MHNLPRNEIRRLVVRAQQGDKTAFSGIYQATSQAQYYTALSILKDPGLAEDAVQTIYMKVYMNLHTLSQPATFLSWLSSITYNTCMYLLRGKRKASTELEEEIPAELPDLNPSCNLLNQIILKEDQQFLINLLDNLTPHHRTVILLRYYQGLKIREIAKVMGTSEGTARSRLHYALKKLQNLMKEKGYQNSGSILGVHALLSSSASGVRGSLRTASGIKNTAVLSAALLLLMSLAWFNARPGFHSVHMETSSTGYSREAAKILISTKGKKPEILQASFENGESVPLKKVSSRLYAAYAPRNGNILITISNGKKVTDSRTVSVTGIDVEPPALDGYLEENKLITFYLSDDCSGIDPASITAELSGSKHVPVQFGDSGASVITVPYTAGSSLRLKAKDRAGNEKVWNIETESAPSAATVR